MNDANHNPSAPIKKQQCAFGLWPSSLSGSIVAGKSPRLSEVSAHNDSIFWLTTISEEKSRTAVMQWHEGSARCILPAPYSARSTVHEYGGGSYCISEHYLYFVEASDQGVYRIRRNDKTAQPEPLTPNNLGKRYADLTWDAAHHRLLAICEDHGVNTNKEPTNSIVSIDLSGLIQPQRLVDDTDFFANPSTSPDGKYLSWLQWSQPNMPWDSTQLWLAELDKDGNINQKKRVTAEANESVFQPQWSSENELFFVSDKSNWWNIYRLNDVEKNVPTCAMVTDIDGEFATPQWLFGMSTYALLDDNSLVATYSQNGMWHLCIIEMEKTALPVTPTPLAIDDVYIHSVAALKTNRQSAAYYIGATPYSMPAVKQLDRNTLTSTTLTDDVRPLHKEDTAYGDAFYVHTQCPQTKESSHVYGFYYAPKNQRFFHTGTPPLIVICHGGPTGATNNGLNLKIQYWTQRGFAVADINYRGSTGYGRQYRQQLNGNWGIADVDDLCTATQFLVAQGKADANTLIVKGSSAGGYTVLAALTTRSVFKAGVSLYGIADLESLAKDTHKFEAQYLNSLIGPYPAAKAVYQSRSPIHNMAGFSCPLLLFQGLNDKVVLPNQAQLIADAARKKGLAVTHITYANEGHGFRQQETIEHMLETEHHFYIDTFALK